MKRFVMLSAVLGFGLSLQAVTPAVPTNSDVILQAWCWSFNTIRENLADIASAGYTIVQTPPAQECVTQTPGDKGGGPQLFGRGRWYYHYQPTDWKIGNYQVGTRADLEALCAEASRYGIRIIVDVLPNHTAIDDTRVSDLLDAAVGGHDNLYHSTGFTDIEDYNDRSQCTNYMMGRLPDVNTELPAFQSYYMTYVNDLLKCGVRGFRYDTAKHIALPSDPKDERSPRNNFWDVATGREEVNGIRLALPMDSLFVYGEVLQDRNVKETEYAEYMGLTASGLGHVLRDALDRGQWDAEQTGSFHHPVDPSKLITWVESHDTYCNDHPSAHLTDQQIRLGWVFLTARQQGTPLFYSRPDGSDGPSGNYWGNNLVGARGNDAFRHPLVAAVNHFRTAMQGQPESLTFSTDGAVCAVSRGRKGVALINISQASQTLSIATTMADGTYRDALTGTVYRVRRGVLTGSIQPLDAVILQRK